MLSTVLDYIPLLFSFVALAVSFVSMQFAMTNKRHGDEYRVLIQQMLLLEDNHEALLASHKRLRSRVGMRELRARRKVEQDVPEQLEIEGRPAANDESPEEWKKRMRLKLHKGEIKP